MSDNLQRWYQEKWDSDNATERLYLTHDLKAGDVVFDVGGYTGDWSYEILLRHTVQIHIFEPVKEFYDFCRKRFLGAGVYPVHVHPFGLASRSGYWSVYKNGAASSSCYAHANSEICEFRDMAHEMWNILGAEKLSDVKIDLIAINIEGGEYDLLPAMIDTKLAYQCREIMVQFHPVFASSYDQMNKIRQGLLETHEELWHYPFVWSKYRRR